MSRVALLMSLLVGVFCRRGVVDDGSGGGLYGGPTKANGAVFGLIKFGDGDVLGGSGFGAGGAGEPLFVVIFGFDDDVGLVGGEVGAAVEGVAEAVAAFADGGKGKVDDFAGNDVLFDAEGGNIEAVEDVFGGELEVGSLVNREMKFGATDVFFGVAEFP